MVISVVVLNLIKDRDRLLVSHLTQENFANKFLQSDVPAAEKGVILQIAIFSSIRIVPLLSLHLCHNNRRNEEA